jgi:hypothetical protein
LRPAAPKSLPLPAAKNNLAPTLAQLTVTEPGRLEIFNAVELCWPTEAGHKYQLQWSSDVTNAVWADLGEAVSGSGTNYCTFDSSRERAKRFYRVLVTE